MSDVKIVISGAKVSPIPGQGYSYVEIVVPVTYSVNFSASEGSLYTLLVVKSDIEGDKISYLNYNIGTSLPTTRKDVGTRVIEPVKWTGPQVQYFFYLLLQFGPIAVESPQFSISLRNIQDAKNTFLLGGVSVTKTWHYDLYISPPALTLTYLRSLTNKELWDLVQDRVFDMNSTNFSREAVESCLIAQKEFAFERWMERHW